MLYKKHPFIFVATIFFATGSHLTPLTFDRNVRFTARDLSRRVRKTDPIKSNLEILKQVNFARMFRELHQKLSPEEVRMVTTLGLVTGALSTEGKLPTIRTFSV